LGDQQKVGETCMKMVRQISVVWSCSTTTPVRGGVLTTVDN